MKRLKVLYIKKGKELVEIRENKIMRAVGELGNKYKERGGKEMFFKTQTIIRQGEKILELEEILFNTNKQNIDLMCAFDEAQEEFLMILDSIEELVANTSDFEKYKVLKYIKNQKEILEKDIIISKQNEPVIIGINN